MLKELFEAHFYYTFSKIEDKVLMVKEVVRQGDFSLWDPMACGGCKFVCNENAGEREQLKLTCTQPVSIVNLEQVFNYVKEDMGEVCDYMLEGPDNTYLVEMTCSTTEYVKNKRAKARSQFNNTLEKLYTCRDIRDHIESKKSRYVVFSWKETFPEEDVDDVGTSMKGMTILADAVYSPENESGFSFGFKLREIRYPDILMC